MVALLPSMHHEGCGKNPVLLTGQRYIICPCWRPLTPPGRVFVPDAYWNKSGLALSGAYGFQYQWSRDEMQRLARGWGGRIITANRISGSAQSIWAENDLHDWDRRGLCVHRQFLQLTQLMDLHYLIDSPGHPATLSPEGEELCPAEARTIWVRVTGYDEAEVRLNTIFDADLNEWGHREKIAMCLSGS